MKAIFLWFVNENCSEKTEKENNIFYLPKETVLIRERIKRRHLLLEKR